MVEHRSGERMSQHVRSALPECGHTGESLRHLIPHLVAVHPLPLGGHKKRVSGALGICISPRDIFLERGSQLVPEGNDALLVSLSRHLDFAGGEIHHAVVQVDQFRESHAGGIEY